MLICKSKAIGGMFYGKFSQLYNSLKVPIVTCSTCIWGHSSYVVVNTVQNNASKYFLGVGKYPSNNAAVGDMDWMNFHDHQNVEVVHLCSRLNNVPSCRITRSVCNWAN